METQAVTYDGDVAGDAAEGDASVVVVVGGDGDGAHFDGDGAKDRGYLQEILSSCLLREIPF
jgi:hypothetical protein